MKLKRMDGTSYAGPWSPPVLGAYLERRLQSLVAVPGPRIALVCGPATTVDERQARSTEAMQRAMGKALTIRRRADGKPTTRGQWNVTAAHCGAITLAVAGAKARGALGCDLESVTTRSRACWQDLLRDAHLPLVDLVASDSGDAFDVAATRVWGALEALKKAGAALDTPLALADTTPDRWVLFTAGAYPVATYVAQVQGVAEPLVVAVTVGGRLVP